MTRLPELQFDNFFTLHSKENSVKESKQKAAAHLIKQREEDYYFAVLHIRWKRLLFRMDWNVEKDIYCQQKNLQSQHKNKIYKQ